MPESLSNKIIIPENVENKIRLFCAMSPYKEWSGILFYKGEGNFTDSVTIRCEDILIMDQGSAAATEIDYNTPEIARYIFENRDLLKCSMGLIHSHNTMNAFFSSVDMNAIAQEGKEMNNFVSLVVNNAGQYVAGITRKIHEEVKETIDKRIKVTTALFKSPDEIIEPEKRTRTSSTYERDEIEFYPLVVEKSEVISLPKDVERFSKIINKRTELPSEVKPFYNSKYYEESPWNNHYNTKDEKQLSLFEEEKEPEKSDITNADINTIFKQLLYGTPFVAKYQKGDEESYKRLFTVYKSRFPRKEDFRWWFRNWLDYLISEYELYSEDLDGWVFDIRGRMKKLGNDAYVQIMLDELEQYA